MISAVVFTPEAWIGDDIARQRETVVRSLVWLVSAVVSGVVRDVTLAVPAGLGLSEVADQSGCALIEADTEAERIAQAVSGTRQSRLIVMLAGFQPDAGLIEEIDIFIRHKPEDAVGVLLGMPSSVLQRLFPQRSDVVGALLSRSLATSVGGGFDRLARAARRRGMPLQARARPIP